MADQIQDLQLTFSDTYIDFLANILSIRACTVANEQGHTTIASIGLIITSYPFGDGEGGNTGYYVNFKHRDLGVVILKGRRGRVFEEAIVMFFRELEWVASEVMKVVVAHEEEVSKEYAAKKENMTKEEAFATKDA
jgi:hypothetical protein